MVGGEAENQIDLKWLQRQANALLISDTVFRR